MKTSFLRLLLLVLLLFVLVRPALFSALEYHLFLRGGYALPQFKIKDNYNSFSWQRDFISINENNLAEYTSAGHAAGEIGLLVWLAPAWGFSLQAGLTEMNLEAANQFKLDWTWFDGEQGNRRQFRKSTGRLTRYWFEGLLNKRVFLSSRSAMIVSVGGGLHRYRGSLVREAGWADALETETQYLLDWFLLPLRAEVNVTRVTGRIGLDFEQRLDRRFTLNAGLAWQFSAPFRTAWRLQERGTLVGREGNMRLEDPQAGLEFEQEELEFKPGGLRLHVGLQLRI